MNDRRFDNLARGLAGAGWSRRGLARALTGAVFAPLLGWAPEAAAKKKKGKKKAKKCKNGAVKCGKACVNTQTNALHCGRCGRSCGINVACVNGACEGGGCPTDQILCGTLCVDPDDNDAHCGRCHNPCNGDLTCINGECGCASDTKCGNQCVDTQTDPDHCNGCNQACGAGVSCVGGACNPSGCDPGEIDCGGGLCIPDGEHACCNQADCGGPGQSINGIQCNTTTHRCECELAGHGICQRFENKAGICGKCCPGADTQLGEKCLSEDDDLICIDQTINGCNCPSDKPLSCRSENGSHIRCRANGNDPRACGGFCQDCTAGGQQACCINGQCVGSAGCGPNGGGPSCFNSLCGSCDRFCSGDTPMCCNRGPDTPAACVAPAAGGFCPAIA